MDKTLEQLAQYIGQQLRQGMSENDIRTSLLQNRWTQDWVDAAFNIVHQNPALFGAAASYRPTSSGQYRSIEVKPQGTSKGKQFLLLGAIFLLMLGFGIGAYFLFQSGREDAPKSGLNQSQNRTKTPDDERKSDLNTLLSDLADIYVASGSYPTHGAVKSPEFTAQNPSFVGDAITDPDWSARNASCAVEGKPILATTPVPGCYAYGATAQDGAACDGASILCTRMTIATVLADNSPYTVVLERNIEIED